MAGGSTTRENPGDQRCEHCGLFYSSQGITTHEPNCPVKKLGVDVVPVAQIDDETDTLSRESDPEPEPADGIEAGGSRDSDSQTQGAATATDGGSTGLPLSGPPEQPDDDLDDQDVDVDDDPDVETYDCANCGDDLGVTRDDLDESFTADTDRHGNRGYINCSSCGHRMGWSP